MKILNSQFSIFNKFSIIKSKVSALRLKFELNEKVLKLRNGVKNNFVQKNFFTIIYLLLATVSFYSILYFSFWRAPRPFPQNALAIIERGETLNEIAVSLKEQRVVRSAFWLKFFVRASGGQSRIIAGDYYFPEPVGIFTVIRMIHKGNFGMVPLRVTIPEGLSSYEIAELLEEKLPAFDGNDFISKVDDNNYEGVLFPDTYFFLPNTDANEVILTMRENFARQIKPYEEDIDKSGRSIQDLIIMASILEGEGNSLESKRVISGILWKRLSMEMLLQVDAPFKYYNGKHSYTLTTDDLQEDHPYNTYVNKGLPPTAICNPGIDSLRAAIAPTASDYLYFLSDKKGNIHYAVDFEGHKANRERYLR